MPVIYTLGQVENVIFTIVSAAAVENAMLMTQDVLGRSTTES